MHQTHIALFESRRYLDQIHSQHTPLVDQAVDQLTNLYPVQATRSWCIDGWHDRRIQTIGINGEVIGSTIRSPLKNGGRCAMEATRFFRLSVFLNTTFPCLFVPAGLKLVFAKSIPVVVLFIRTFPIVKSWYSNSTLAHCDAG